MKKSILLVLIGLILVFSFKGKMQSAFYQKKNAQFSDTKELDSIFFRTLLSQHRFRELEETIEHMYQSLTDVYERQRITVAIESIFRGQRLLQATQDVSVWCNTHPNSYIAQTIKGCLYTETAWRHRGGGYAYSVTDKGLDKFTSSLHIAEKALTRAYELNPDFSLSSTEMITVCMGLCYPKKEMEKWFQRAISVPNIETRSYGSKGLYLQPKWHGSVEEIVSFAYETDRKGVPLFTIATTYGDAWYEMPSRHSDLLHNKTFLKRAARAYERSLKKYPYRIVQRKFCAFFAAKSENYSLAAKQFKHFSWKEDDKHLRLWKSKEAYDADKEKSIRLSNQKLEPTR